MTTLTDDDLARVSGPGSASTLPVPDSTFTGGRTMTQRTCTVGGCDRPHKARGWCIVHYCRWVRWGDPLGGHWIDQAEQRRFIAGVVSRTGNADTPCVDWPWALDKGGYARAYLDGTEVRVSHMVLELSGISRPPQPRDKALHACDRPVCVAPWHLRWGTQRSNMQDAIERDRVRFGSAHPRAKLVEAEVVEIRGLAAEGHSLAAIARQYSVSVQTISNIVRRVFWVRVP